LKRQLVELGIARSDVIVVGSAHAARAACAHGAPEDRVRIVPQPGVDMSLFRPGSRRDARQRTGFADDDIIVLSPRGLATYLNPLSIVEAVARLSQSSAMGVRKPVLVALYQPGNEVTPLRARAVELGVRLELRPSVAFEQMPDLYRAADVVVSYSSNDSLPNTLLEAMACRVPIVAGDIPPVRELLTAAPLAAGIVPLDDVPALAEAIAAACGVDEDRVAAGAAIAGSFDSELLCERFRQLVLDAARL
jgi:D-inositol-3-phosphate glycosyltransferase